MSAISLQKKAISTKNASRNAYVSSAQLHSRTPVVYMTSKKLSLVLTLTPWTVIWLLRPAADPLTELTQITCRLLRKDLCNISLQLFGVMRSYMTSKFGFEHTHTHTHTYISSLLDFMKWRPKRGQFMLTASIIMTEKIGAGHAGILAVAAAEGLVRAWWHTWFMLLCLLSLRASL